jgi:hypothetical protein
MAFFMVVLLKKNYLLHSYNRFLLFFWNIQLELLEDKLFFLEATIGSR